MKKQIIISGAMTLIAVAICLVMVSYADGNKKQNAESKEQTDSKTASSQKIKEMNPKFGRSLEFGEKDYAEYQKIIKLLSGNEWNYNYNSLSAKQKEFVKDHNIEYDSRDYWGTEREGCSWYCGGGPESITASSYLKSNNSAISYLPKNIHDFPFETAWVEGVKGYGIGEYIVYHFSPVSPRITEIKIANGYVKSEKAYCENSRVKKLKMYIDDKPVAILNLKDIRREQIFEFEPIGRRNAVNTDSEPLNKLPKWTLKFEILEVYQGDKYDDTAISEIFFDGIDVH